MNIGIIITGIIGAIVILINPFIGLLAVVILIPQALIPAVGSSIFGIFTMATPIKLIGGLTFVSSFIRHILDKKNWNFLKKPQVRFFILFLVWIFISGFTQPGSFTRENFTLFISFTMLGFIILSLVTDIKRFRLVLWVGIISILIVAIQTIVHYLNYTQHGLAYKQVMLRVSGATYDPNYFAISLLPFLGITFYNVTVEKKKILKIFSLIISIALFLALVITFSRAGLIGFFVMILIMTLKAKRKMKASFLLLLALIILINVLPGKVWERFEKTNIEGPSSDGDIASTKRRLMLAKAAVKMFVDHPLFGVGVGNYYFECKKYEPIWAGRAHSMYLETLAELGIVGFFLFLCMLFYTFRSLQRIINSKSNLNAYASGLYVGLTGFLIAALFFHAQHEKVLWFVVFMSLALENISVSELARLRVGRVKGKARKRKEDIEQVEVAQ